MCNGDCSSCGKQCALSKIAAKLTGNESANSDPGNNLTQKPTEDISMSQSTLSCHSSEPEKIVSQGERINAISAGGKYCLIGFAFIAAIIAGGILHINGKINDNQLKNAEELTRIKTEYSVRIGNIEKQMDELKRDCEQAQRDYANARQTVSRMRKSQ